MDPVVTCGALHHLAIVVIIFITLEAHGAVVSLIKQPSAVRTQTLVMIPLCVPALSWSHTTTLAPDACHTHPRLLTFVGFGVVGTQTGRMITILTAFTLQQRLGFFILAATNAAELAATTAPVLLVLLQWTL